MKRNFVIFLTNINFSWEIFFYDRTKCEISKNYCPCRKLQFRPTETVESALCIEKGMKKHSSVLWSNVSGELILINGQTGNDADVLMKTLTEKIRRKLSSINVDGNVNTLFSEELVLCLDSSSVHLSNTIDISDSSCWRTLLKNNKTRAKKQ